MGVGLHLHEEAARVLARADYEATFDTGKFDDYNPAFGPYDERWESTASSYRKERIAHFESVLEALAEQGWSLERGS
jgi:hypothetical protein